MQVKAYTKYARMSPQKVRKVARAIQGRNAAEALEMLNLIPRKSARLIGKTLKSAIANAENNHGLDVDDLVVHSAYVGKNMMLKRGRPRARGRYGRILKPFSQITIVVRENREEE